MCLRSGPIAASGSKLTIKGLPGVFTKNESQFICEPASKSRTQRGRDFVAGRSGEAKPDADPDPAIREGQSRQRLTI